MKLFTNPLTHSVEQLPAYFFCTLLVMFSGMSIGAEYSYTGLFPESQRVPASIRPHNRLTLADVRSSQFDIPAPPGSVSFGEFVAVLPSGNIVVGDSQGGIAQSGAVYFYNTNGVLLSTLSGTSSSDDIGSDGIFELANGNIVVASSHWNGFRGAVTWINGETGLNATVSAANSLVGPSTQDRIGSGGIVTLSNGNFVVPSTGWGGTACNNCGAVTWVSASMGLTGAVTTSNSLTGTTDGDAVGTGVFPLNNGNYVVTSPAWASSNIGAATWVNGSGPYSGVVSGANSLVGASNSDNIGSAGVVALSNGNYVVRSPNWRNGSAVAAGAVTWRNGGSASNGIVSSSNSLVGSTTSDQVGRSSVVALTNGNFVVSNYRWDNSGILDAGAVTWGNGASGSSGIISASNSLVGSTSMDYVGGIGATPLTNGNYVVASPRWNSASADVGAVTWANGNTGLTGPVSTSNSLIGKSDDQLGVCGVVALSNGNYVIASPSWSSVTATNVGAVTWGNGSSGLIGQVTAGNSLVGVTSEDKVGNSGMVAFINGDQYCVSGVVALTNGNYVVASPSFYNGPGIDRGSVTWGNGNFATAAIVSANNSLLASGQTTAPSAIPLPNGNYVVVSRGWDNGSLLNVGAVTWGNGNGAMSGFVSAGNSFTGNSVGDKIGDFGVVVLGIGHYVIFSEYSLAGGTSHFAAATLSRGIPGVQGTLNSDNSVLGIGIPRGTLAKPVSYDYVAQREKLVIGRPEDNSVSIFRPGGGATVFSDGFE